jgi:serine/threonine-protein kinase
VHRDLKPENLFVTSDGRIKVLDFGIARLREASAANRMTQAGDTMGTPAFMAPEHARGLWDEVDERSDIWAVGAVMFHLFSGSVVHDGRTLNEQLLNAMTASAAPLASAAPHVSEGVARIVDRALAFDRDARWPSAQSMRDAIRAEYEAQRGEPMTADQAPGAEPLQGSPERSFVRLRGVPAATPQGDRATVRPVAITMPPTARFQTQLAVAGLMASVFAVVLAVACSAWLGGSRRRASTPTSAQVAASLPPEPAAPPPPRESAPAEANTMPEIAATDLPFAPAPPPAVSPGAGARSRPECLPPYVVDPTSGKKRWKLECL